MSVNTGLRELRPGLGDVSELELKALRVSSSRTWELKDTGCQIRRKEAATGDNG